MNKNSIEHIRFNNLGNEALEKSLSSIITDTIYLNCHYEFEKRDGDAFSSCYSCDYKLKNCKECYETPKWEMPFEDGNDMFKKYIIEEGTTSKLDISNMFYDVEDIIARKNCNIVIVSQKVYRHNSKRDGYAVRMLISPTIDFEEVIYNQEDIDQVDLFDFYNKDREWPIKVWGASFDELFSIMNDKNRGIYEKMLQELENDINIDPIILVEKCLVSEFKLSPDSDWNIEVLDGNTTNDGEYFYSIDCRALFSLIKQIMIHEDLLYPKQYGYKGRHKILYEFRNFK